MTLLLAPSFFYGCNSTSIYFSICHARTFVCCANAASALIWNASLAVQRRQRPCVGAMDMNLYNLQRTTPNLRFKQGIPEDWQNLTRLWLKLDEQLRISKERMNTFWNRVDENSLRMVSGIGHLFLTYTVLMWILQSGSFQNKIGFQKSYQF